MSNENFFQLNDPNNTNRLDDLWSNVEKEVQALDTSKSNWWKSGDIPLARVKKIMKEEDLAQRQIELQAKQHGGEQVNMTAASQSPKFMIANEAPWLLALAAELFTRELTTRSWKYADRNRRKTLQRSDLHAAVGESDLFDFLIDIVPRGNSNPLMDHSVVIPPASVPHSLMPPPTQGAATNMSLPSTQPAESLPPVDFGMEALVGAAGELPAPTDLDDFQEPPFAAHPPGSE